MGWMVDSNKENALIESYKQALQIKMASSEQEVRKLSGGNQQKSFLHGVWPCRQKY